MPKKGNIPWNKGLKGVQISSRKGQKLSEEHRMKSSIGHIGQTPWNKGKSGIQVAWNKGKKMPDDMKLNLSLKLKGRKRGFKSGGRIRKYTKKEYNRIWNKKYRASMICAGELSFQTIQLVYEDNIKKYGTLTCYLCEKPIEFGKDNLEHKHPLSRGGSNLYDNLEVSCKSCNSRKRHRTVEEYKATLLAIK